MDGAIYLGFANKKGGVGKTTLAQIFSSILAYEMGYKLAVIDCDSGQHSFFYAREKEREALSRSEKLMRQLVEFYSQKGKLLAYDVFQSDVAGAVKLADQLASERNLDVVVFDLPGRYEELTLVQACLSLDYIIVPIEMDRQVLHSSIVFATVIREAMAHFPNTRLKGVYALWNRVKNGVSKSMMEEYNKLFQQKLGLGHFANFVADLTRFRYSLVDVNNINEAFRSTYVTPRWGSTAAAGLHPLLRELDGLLKSGLISNPTSTETESELESDVDNNENNEPNEQDE